MWVSPNHPNPPFRPAAPPDDDGQPLGAFPRGDGRDELRVTLKSFEGRPYVALRVWSRDARGQFWPAKGKGVSVRLGEVAGVIAALQAAAAAAAEPDGQRPNLPFGQGSPGDAPRARRPGGPRGGPGGNGQAPRCGDRRPAGRPDWRAANLPRLGQVEGAEAFDEFGSGADRR